MHIREEWLRFHIQKKYQNIEIHVQNIKIEKEWSPVKMKKNLILKINIEDKTSSVERGHSLLFTSNLINTCHTDQHNSYYEYLCSNNIEYLTYVNDINIQLLGYDYRNPLYHLRYRWRNSAIQFYRKNISTFSFPLIKALLFGDKDELNRELKNNFSKSGTIHLLAVSGMHVGIITLLLMKGTQVIFPQRSKYSRLRIMCISIGIIIFSELSGANPPVQRASIMAIIYLFARTASLEYKSLNIVAFTALALLIFDPHSLFELSFQLSFSAVVGIIIFYPILEIFTSNSLAYFKHMINMINVGISAQIMIIPMLLYYFQEVSLLSPFTSVLSALIVLMIIVASVLLPIAFCLNIWLVQFLGEIIQCLSQLLKRSTDYYAQLSFLNVKVTSFDLVETVILFFGIFCIALSFHLKRKLLLKTAFLLLSLQAIYHMSLKFYSYFTLTQNL